MYIRTKDGVYEVKREEILCGVKFYDVEDDEHLNRIREEQIIDQSENLDELCDEFVLYDNQLKTYGVFDKKVITFKWIQNHSTIYKGMTIYGAIWTSKGLIYVAKMNENGELVLI